MSDEIDSIVRPPSAASPIAPGTPDDHGTPFDPVRHIPKKHPKTGRWMPKGGRKVNPPAAASATTEPTKQTAPANQSTEPTPTPAPVTQGGATPTLDAIERASAADPSETAGQKAVDGKAVLVENVDQQADTLWRGLYNLVGTTTGAPEEAMRSGAAHVSNRDVLAAWMRESGVRITGKWALVISILSYFSETANKPKTAEKVSGWKAKLFSMGKKKQPAPSQETPAAAPETPAPAAPIVHQSPYMPAE